MGELLSPLPQSLLKPTIPNGETVWFEANVIASKKFGGDYEYAREVMAMQKPPCLCEPCLRLWESQKAELREEWKRPDEDDILANIQAWEEKHTQLL